MNAHLPQNNFLAVTGLLADPKGTLITPSRGPLNLSWLFHVPAETARRGRERLAQGGVKLDQETLACWFCISGSGDQSALDFLDQRAWRKALKIWKAREGERWALHNRATLHRLMYLDEAAENRGGHLRKAVELYYRLLQEENAAYRELARWASEELEVELEAAHKGGDDDMVARSLLLISQTRGMAACEELQERLLLEEIDDLSLQCATTMRELLPYLGSVRVPPHTLLSSAQDTVELDVLPPAVRLAYRLVPGSRQRKRVDEMAAELCSLVAQILFKGREGRAGKKWQGEARRWAPEVAGEWREPEPEHLGDEKAPRVEFSEPEPKSQPETEAEMEVPSRGRGWLGVTSRATLVRPHEAREEWLEAVRVLGIAVFPLRRYALYRNLDTGEIGNSQRLPLKIWHYVWQILVLGLLCLAVLVGGLRLAPALKAPLMAPSTPGMDTAERQAQLTRAVERLKRLAQAEAELRKKPKPDPTRLKAIEDERRALFEKVERLEEQR